MLPQAAALFFLSGAAALVYQTAWQRVLATASGAGIYSVAMIVGAFMAGLGIGSQLGGAYSERLSPRRALLRFAAIEAGIGVFGLLSPFLLYGVLYERAAWLYAAPGRAGVAHFTTLLLPTTLMGMSLPLLVRAMLRDAASAARTVGALYGVNVLGAAFGAVATPWLLVRFLGITGATHAAAGANLLVAAFAGLLAPRVPDTDARLPEPDASAGAEAPGREPFGLWLGLYAASGFVALALEILWFRIVDVAVKSSTFTFGSVLALYLLGCGAGSLAGVRIAARVRRPLRTFLLCQCAVLAASASGVLLLVQLPLPAFREYWSRYEGLILGRDDSWAMLAGLYVFLPLLLFGVPTFLMGLVFPVLQRAVHDDVRKSGRRVGALQAANIAGCVAGSLLVGLVGLSVLGSMGVLRALCLLGLGFAGLGLRREGARGFGLAATALVVAAVMLPGDRALWARLHGTPAERLLVAEDASGVAAIVPETSGGVWRVSVNGKGNSQLPYGSVHTYLGALPVLMHPAPVDVALIGLGSGDTAWAAACRRETVSLTVFELNRPQPGLLRELAAREPYPPLLALLQDPRLRLVLDDGRAGLEHGAARYDMIEADALRPTSAGSGSLYSVEFFRACARRLKPGGFVCTWAPTPRSYASFCRALPHVVELSAGETVLVGSLEPFEMDRGLWRSRAESPEVVAWLGEGIAAQMVAVLRTSRHADPALAAGELNEDLRPRDEFLAP